MINRYLIPTVIILLIFLFAGLGIWGDHGLLHLLKMRQRIAGIRTETGRVKGENRLLRRQVYLLQSDDRYQEMTVRRELKMIRPNEQVFVFREP
ncbi:MAG: septum formation initiator family protein [Deltaproteobacteria bacterium]|nr:septum formation initiator family protein [Deltaproteobacteria bacterium]